MTEAVGEKAKVRVYDPTAEGPGESDALAPRPADLNALTIGLLDNTKDMVDVLLEEVRMLLTADFPNASFRYFRKESVSGAAAGLMEQVAACDVVVNAIGD
jgi:hypothetical protein